MSDEFLTVGELVKHLSGFRPDMLVRVTSYCEGQMYDHLADHCCDTVLRTGKVTIVGKGARQVDGQDRDYVRLEFEEIDY